MGRGPSVDSSPKDTHRWPTDTGKDAQHLKLLENSSQNYSEISPHIGQNGHHKKFTGSKYWRECREK